MIIRRLVSGLILSFLIKESQSHLGLYEETSSIHNCVVESVLLNRHMIIQYLFNTNVINKQFKCQWTIYTKITKYIKRLIL